MSDTHEGLIGTLERLREGIVGLAAELKGAASRDDTAEMRGAAQQARAQLGNVGALLKPLRAKTNKSTDQLTVANQRRPRFADDHVCGLLRGSRIPSLSEAKRDLVTLAKHLDEQISHRAAGGRPVDMELRQLAAIMMLTERVERVEGVALEGPG